MSLPIRKQSAPVLRGLSILLYGMPKVGKTTAASRFPEPVFLSCEPGGTNFVTGEIDVVDVEGIDHLEKLIPHLATSSYKTIVLDGFTWLINSSVRGRAKNATGNQRRRIYAEVTDQMARILGELLTMDRIVVATGHSRIVEVDDDTSPATPKRGDDEGDLQEIRPDINPSLAGGVLGLFSIICYCYPDQAGSRMITKPIKTSTHRILAGDRSGKLDRTMPLDAGLLMQQLRDFATKPQTPK